MATEKRNWKKELDTPGAPVGKLYENRSGWKMYCVGDYRINGIGCLRPLIFCKEGSVGSPFCYQAPEDGQFNDKALDSRDIIGPWKGDGMIDIKELQQITHDSRKRGEELKRKNTAECIEKIEKRIREHAKLGLGCTTVGVPYNCDMQFIVNYFTDHKFQVCPHTAINVSGSGQSIEGMQLYISWEEVCLK